MTDSRAGRPPAPDEVETLFWCNEWLFYTALLACPPSLVAMWMRWEVL